MMMREDPKSKRANCYKSKKADCYTPLLPVMRKISVAGSLCQALGQQSLRTTSKDIKRDNMFLRLALTNDKCRYIKVPQPPEATGVVVL